MKKFAVILFCLFGFGAFSQIEWNGTGFNNPSLPIWRTGAVGIGSAPNALYFLEVNGGDFHVNGDSYLDGGLRVGSLRVTNNQIGMEANADFYINNFNLGNGKVWLGKPLTGSVTVLSDFFSAGEITSAGDLHVGVVPGMKINGNQICIENSNDLYINNAAMGTGNVFLGKPWAGLITVMRDFKVDGKTVIANATSSGLNSASPHFNTGLLQVKGKIVCQEVVVTAANWADFVFDEDYELMPIRDVERFYKEHHHLPGVPSTKEVLTEGNDLAKTDALLLQKVEELTLYVVDLKKEIEIQKKIISDLIEKGR